VLKEILLLAILTLIILSIVTTTYLVTPIPKISAQTVDKSRPTFSMDGGDSLKGSELQPLSEGPITIKAKVEELKSRGVTLEPYAKTQQPVLTKNKDGYYQLFNNGQYGIWWSKSTGAHEVHGDILTKWRQLGFDKGWLGYPTSDEKDLPEVPTGRYNQFEHGVIAKADGIQASNYPDLADAVRRVKVSDLPS